MATGNEILVSYQTPFRTYVKFNSDDDNSAAPRKGFKMNWRQILC